MTYAEAVLRLGNHANLTAERLPASESLTHVLWDATHTRTVPDLGPLTADLLACLDAVNREWNGPNPSERAGRADERIPSNVAYMVSCIITAGLQNHRRWLRDPAFDPAACDGLENAIYAISFAWAQVLASDIDDLLEGADLD